MIIPSKLFRPAPPQNCTPRPRLYAHLDAWQRYRCTYVHAPTGYGKSSLVAMWLDQLCAPGQAAPARVAWLALDAEERDPRQFLRYLAAALDGVWAGLSAQMQPLLADPGSTPEHILTHLLATLQPAPAELPPDRFLLLTLDDYHRVTCPAIDALTTMLLERAPAPLRFILISRNPTAAPLSRLFAAGQVLEIGGADLRFQRDELVAFLACHGFDGLPAEMVDQLLERTEGWIAALQLVSIDARQRGDAAALLTTLHGARGWLASYLTEELLGRQPPLRRQFLLRSALLERFNAPLAAAVTGANDAYRMLAEVAEANLFLIPLDDDHKWFRYHHLFQELLQHHLLLEEPPAAIGACHRRAAAWLAAAGDVAAAIFHLLAVPDEDAAAALVAAHTRPAMLRGDTLQAQHWINSLPEEAVRRSMPLLLDRCRLDTLHDNAQLMAHVEQAERTLAISNLPQRLAKPYRTEIAVHRTVAHYLQSDFAGAEIWAREAQAHSDNLEDLASVALEFALMHLARRQGDLRAALAHSEKAIAACERASFHIGLVSLRRESATLAMYAGESGRASDQFKRLFEQVDWGQPFVVREVILACLSAARHYYWLNNLVEAHRSLEIAVDLANSLADQRLVAAVHCLGQACYAVAPQLWRVPEPLSTAGLKAIGGQFPSIEALAVRLLIKQGKINEAWRQTAHLAHDSPVAQGGYVTPQLVAYLHAHTARGIDLAATAPLFIRALSATTGQAAQLDRLILLSIFAWQQWRLGEDQSANQALSEALTAAVKTGYTRAILDIAELAPLLAASAHPAAASLLSQMESETAPHSLARLTAQERTVLELLAADRKYREIATELDISMSTVRTHVSNIYAKLGVSRRLEAIRRARNADLIHER